MTAASTVASSQSPASQPWIGPTLYSITSGEATQTAEQDADRNNPREGGKQLTLDLGYVTYEYRVGWQVAL